VTIPHDRYGQPNYGDTDEGVSRTTAGDPNKETGNH
jgi:hypothetical protein